MKELDKGMPIKKAANVIKHPDGSYSNIPPSSYTDSSFTNIAPILEQQTPEGGNRRIPVTHSMKPSKSTDKL